MDDQSNIHLLGNVQKLESVGEKVNIYIVFPGGIGTTVLCVSREKAKHYVPNTAVILNLEAGNG